MSVSKTARDKGAAAVEQARSQGPEAVAELMYGGRMGNTEPGDGHRYRGRGFTQLTGRDNYTAASEALGVDLVNNPEMAADPEVAAKVSAWYWKERGGLSEAAQSGDTSEVTRLINGGQNGLADREVQTNRYLAAAQAGELTIEPQQDPGTQSGASPNEPGVSTTPLIASTSGTPAPASPPAVEADARPVTAASLGYDIASNAAPVEPVLPSEPVTAIDDRQAAKAFHPAPARPQPGASRRAQRERAPAPTASASQDADGSGKPSAPRGGVSAPGVNDIQIGFSDPVLTLMAMDRI